MNSAAMLKKRCFFIGLAGCLALADQWSKHFIQSHWVLYQPDEIWPFLNITLHYNTGIAFSFLNNLGSWQRWILSAVSAGLSVLILVWLYRLPKEKTLLPWALASILGGALGNLWDRITVGYVVDFIDLHVAGWHFAVFNLADTFISLGAVILFFELWFQPKR